MSIYSWVNDLYNDMGCDGMNCLSAVETNVREVIQANIPIVTSANNQFENHCIAPAQTPARMGYGNEYWVPSAERTITVGGLDISDERYDCRSQVCGQGGELGSNIGPCVSIYAPAKNLRVANITSFTGYHVSNAVKSGTSFSAAIVSGIAARLLDLYPTLTARGVWDAIYARKRPLGGNFDGDQISSNDFRVYISPEE